MKEYEFAVTFPFMKKQIVLMKLITKHGQQFKMH